MARLGNKYLADEEPWKVIKTIRSVQTQMYVALQSGCVEFSFANLSCRLPLKIIKNFKIESPLNWNTIAQNLI
jgi:methionyl-tRNA synthetase